jgi:hypothetical protein
MDLRNDWGSSRGKQLSREADTALDLDAKRSIRKSDCPVLPVIEFTG